MRRALLLLWTIAMLGLAVAGFVVWWGIPAAVSVFVVGEMLLPARSEERRSR